MYRYFPVTCAVCSEPQTITFLMQFTHTGDHDSDLRPSGAASWVWPEAVVRCVGCGACAERIDSLPAEAISFVRSAEYRAIADAPLPRSIRDALAGSALAEHLGRGESAFLYALAASWAADDEERRRAKTGEPSDPTIGESARSRAIEVWLRECGDVFAADLPRCRETAQATVTGEPVLDNQVLVDLHRRLREWDRARVALVMARHALDASVQAWGPYGETDQEMRQLNEGCAVLLDLEEALINALDSSRVDARASLPLWFAEG